MSHYPFLKEEEKKYLFPIPSREFILAHLVKREKPTSREELVKELAITNGEQLEGLQRRLHAMERDGQLIFTQRRHYTLPKNPSFLQGTVIGHRNGFGFLRVTGSKNDYYLSTDQMKIAIHGDIVIAQTKNSDRKGRPEARIIQVIVPTIKKIVGRFIINAGSAFVVPNDSRFNFNIFIPPKKTQGAHVGCIVVVVLTKRPTQYNKAIGKVVEVLGDHIGIGMVVNIAIRTYDIPYTWPPEVEKKIADLKDEIPETVKRGRIDLRALPLMTIDSEEAKDFDDAVYCEKNSSGGWRLWVAIADVSYYVRPHTPLDQEASWRATSIYFPSQVIPMLPEILSNELCSLNPRVDRLCLVCEMTISNKGRLSSYKFYEAVMNSHARLTYNKVWQILQGQSELRINYTPLIKPLTQLYEMYKILQKARIQRGGISFEIEEAKFIFNSEYHIERIEPLKRNDAHKMIEECMIMANIAAARFVEEYKEPVLYRVHDRPSNSNITSLRMALTELGLTLKGGDRPKTKDYADIINLATGRPDHGMLQAMLLRSMEQAIYAPENRGHFGLALQAYAHFTSPIRRYPDLVLHRAIKYLIARKNGNINGRSTPTGGWHSKFEEMLKLGQQCSLSERRADEAIRDVVDWLKCDFMKNHIGKIFNGIISSVAAFGFFVRINRLFIDGLVHISSLDKDYYHYDNVRQRLIGESSNSIYRIGDTVTIRIESVHMSERKINFSLISNPYKTRYSKKISSSVHEKISLKESSTNK